MGGNLISTTSSLSTTIGLTSNYLLFFSTVSIILASSFSTLELGLSSISTSFGSNISTNYSIFSTLGLFTSSISSGNVQASSISTTILFFQVGQGSTMSSLTQQIGVLNTSKIIASSFTGTLNDATTIVIQKI